MSSRSISGCEIYRWMQENCCCKSWNMILLLHNVARIPLWVYQLIKYYVQGLALVLILLVMVLAEEARGQFPQRKASLGLRVSEVTGGLRVDAVMPELTGAAAGLQPGDVLRSINETSVLRLAEFNNLAKVMRTGDEVRFRFDRHGIQREQMVRAVMKPYEQVTWAVVDYDWVKYQAGYLRAMVWRPKGGKQLPAILLIPGYGCSSVESYSSSYNGHLIRAWVEAGYVVVTVEKSGVGDSAGCRPCEAVDLATDIATYNVAYDYMERLPFINPRKLFIWGHSMGGTIAPEVARLHHPAGVIVFGSVFRPWSEFLLEMHRVQKPLLEGMDMAQTEEFIRGIQRVYFEFFVLKRSPAELFQHPPYRLLVKNELNYEEGSTNMWGRHWKFWQQLDSINLARSWGQVSCPVLVLHGGSDYEQCSLVEPMLTADAVNSVRPGNAKRVTIPDLDHFMMRSRDWKQAVEHFRSQQYQKGNFHNGLASETLQWLKTVCQER